MISVRKQFNNIITGNKEWNSFIVRHMKNDKCICINQSPMVYNPDKNADEANKIFRNIPDPECNICEGAGHVFEEYLLKGLFFFPSYRVAHYEEVNFASTEQNLLTVYMQPTPETDIIMVNDILFNVACELNGEIKHPVLRMKKWILIDKQPIRLDNNKLEYIKIFAKPAIL